MASTNTTFDTTTATMSSVPETTISGVTETTTVNQMMLSAEQRATLHGDTSFVILSAALVFFMTPGLGYFYSGMARSNTALSLIFICFLSMAVVLLQV